MTLTMADSGRRRWLFTAILIGLLYFAIGFASILLAGNAASIRGRNLWRWSAFIASGIVFAAHLGYEHFRLRNPARVTAWHTAVAVAIGAFVLALWSNIHDLGSAAGYRPRMLIALVAWPGITAVPAFLVALVLAAVLGGRQREG